MLRRALLRSLPLLALAAALGGCDKCSDNFLINPFATKPAGTCGAAPSAPR